MTSFGSTTKAFSPEEADLSQINQYTRREFAPAELYTFSVILCDNEIDRDFEQFSLPSLQKLAGLYLGKTGIFDHIPSGKNQAARIYFAEVLADEGKRTNTGEVYHFLRAKAYMVRKGNEELIAEIDGGIKKEVSVGCSVASTRCSICGADRRDGCDHRKGASYDGKLCFHLLENPTDAYEWSFVAVPAQVGAGVTKAFQKTACRDWEALEKVFASGTAELFLSADEVRMVHERFKRFEGDAAAGLLFREDLKKEVRRLAFLAGDAIPQDILDSVMKKMEASELQALRDAYQARIAANGEYDCQLSRCSVGKESRSPSENETKESLLGDPSHGSLKSPALSDCFHPYAIR